MAEKMEATETAQGLLEKIIPPRLEDAGLEDCALPPELIKEAFFKAADAVKSRAASILSPDGDCVNNPWPDVKDPSDNLVGITPVTESKGPCSVEKGSKVPESAAEDVTVGLTDGEEDSGDKLVGIDVPEGGESCVEGLQGLKIGDEKKKESLKNNDDDEEEGEKRPILVEGYGML
jgi:hypothetical protein